MFGDRIKEIRAINNLSQKAFSERLSTSPGFISEIEQGKKKPGADFLYSLLRAFDVNLNWLLTGEGERYINKDRDGGPAPIDEDPEIAGLLDMTREVLKSDTEYAFSLSANVRSFHTAVKTQQRLEDHERRIREIERERSAKEPPAENPPAEEQEGGCGQKLAI